MFTFALIAKENVNTRNYVLNFFGKLNCLDTRWLQSKSDPIEEKCQILQCLIKQMILRKYLFKISKRFEKIKIIQGA